jgi:hypothetical protein
VLLINHSSLTARQWHLCGLAGDSESDDEGLPASHKADNQRRREARRQQKLAAQQAADGTAAAGEAEQGPEQGGTITAEDSCSGLEGGEGEAPTSAVPNHLLSSDGTNPAASSSALEAGAGPILPSISLEVPARAAEAAAARLLVNSSAGNSPSTVTGGSTCSFHTSVGGPGSSHDPSPILSPGSGVVAGHMNDLPEGQLLQGQEQEAALVPGRWAPPRPPPSHLNGSTSQQQQQQQQGSRAGPSNRDGASHTAGAGDTGVDAAGEGDGAALAGADFKAELRERALARAAARMQAASSPNAAAAVGGLAGALDGTEAALLSPSLGQRPSSAATGPERGAGGTRPGRPPLGSAAYRRLWEMAVALGEQQEAEQLEEAGDGGAPGAVAAAGGDQGDAGHPPGSNSLLRYSAPVTAPARAASASIPAAAAPGASSTTAGGAGTDDEAASVTDSAMGWGGRAHGVILSGELARGEGPERLRQTSIDDSAGGLAGVLEGRGSGGDEQESGDGGSGEGRGSGSTRPTSGAILYGDSGPSPSGILTPVSASGTHGRGDIDSARNGVGGRGSAGLPGVAGHGVGGAAALLRAGISPGPLTDSARSSSYGSEQLRGLGDMGEGGGNVRRAARGRGGAAGTRPVEDSVRGEGDSEGEDVGSPGSSSDEYEDEDHMGYDRDLFERYAVTSYGQGQPAGSGSARPSSESTAGSGGPIGSRAFGVSSLLLGSPAFQAALQQQQQQQRPGTRTSRLHQYGHQDSARSMVSSSGAAGAEGSSSSNVVDHRVAREDSASAVLLHGAGLQQPASEAPQLSATAQGHAGGASADAAQGAEYHGATAFAGPSSHRLRGTGNSSDTDSAAGEPSSTSGGVVLEEDIALSLLTPAGLARAEMLRRDTAHGMDPEGHRSLDPHGAAVAELTAGVSMLHAQGAAAAAAAGPSSPRSSGSPPAVPASGEHPVLVSSVGGHTTRATAPHGQAGSSSSSAAHHPQQPATALLHSQGSLLAQARAVVAAAAGGHPPSAGQPVVPAVPVVGPSAVHTSAAAGAEPDLYHQLAGKEGASEVEHHR